MNKPIKLNCPMCNEQFVTTRRDKIWCSNTCSSKFRTIKKMIEINCGKQELINKEEFHYNYDLNKFFLKSLMPNN